MSRLPGSSKTVSFWVNSEMVHIKGADHAVAAHRLIAAALEPRRAGRRESPLVGRDPERKTIGALLVQSLRGGGAVITVAGAPGIGKTRLVRESVATAQGRGFEAFFTYCESHTREVSFHVISRLLRAVFGIGGLTPEEARSRVRRDIPDAGAEDLLLLDDMLGIRDSGCSDA